MNCKDLIVSRHQSVRKGLLKIVAWHQPHPLLPPTLLSLGR